MNHEDVKNYYNTSLGKSEETYENKRWFSSSLRRAEYEMTKKCINAFLDSLQKDKIYRVLELGPGPGTWTKVLKANLKDSSFTLVDISDEMLSQAKNGLADESNIEFTQSDFIEFKSDTLFTLFFSSRALEYFEDKAAFAHHLKTLLAEGAHGFIITKTPHYKRAALRNRAITDFHKKQVRYKELEIILGKSGFRDIESRPVTLVFPLFKSPLLNTFLSNIFSPFRMNAFIEFFTESYSVTFTRV